LKLRHAHKRAVKPDEKYHHEWLKIFPTILQMVGNSGVASQKCLISGE